MGGLHSRGNPCRDRPDDERCERWAVLQDQGETVDDGVKDSGIVGSVHVRHELGAHEFGLFLDLDSVQERPGLDKRDAHVRGACLQSRVTAKRACSHNENSLGKLPGCRLDADVLGMGVRVENERENTGLGRLKDIEERSSRRATQSTKVCQL